MINIEYRGELYDICSIRNEQIDVKNVSEALKYIGKKYGSPAKKEAKKMLIVIDGTSINMKQHYKTELLDGQTLSFLPICGGG